MKPKLICATRKSLSMEERFWSKVDMTETCWLWTGYKDNWGYGQVKYGGKMELMHRVSWILSGNTIPDGHIIRHKCRNKHCVNPEHLETGTVAENNADKVRDGTSARGVKNANAKLTEEQVREIRAKHASGALQQSLAEEYGVTQRAISLIILRKTWAWLP